MRGCFWSTNSSVHFLLLRTVAVPSPIPFLFLQPARRRRYNHRNFPIDDRTFLQAAAASGPPMDPIMKSGGNNEIKLNEEKKESKTTQAAECSSPLSDLPPQPPEKPEPGDCCGNGCFPCVWDLYYEELEAYTKNLEAYNDRVSSKQK
ncbi:uncharacterized protein LOC110102241 [Dendrobium catenatum]|nr:uncharacterized protein LOC110102241 [Dendrobium catenatum]